MLIVIEGLDGAGKSTQVNAVKNYIISKGIELEYMHFPRYDGLYGSLIARFLRGEFGSIEQVHPQLVALLFAEDRHHAAAQIRGWLESGKWVLLDRYVYSNIAYQCSKLENAPSSANRQCLGKSTAQPIRSDQTERFIPKLSKVLQR